MHGWLVYLQSSVVSGIAATGRETGQVKVVTFDEAEETLQGTVSYTHLTLPTILLV